MGEGMMSGAVRGLAASTLVAAALIGLGPEARAQSALCPTSVAVQGGQTGFDLQNGACTNGQAGAFSGAALATQTLSSLTQTTTQESNRNTAGAVSDRRDAERQRCPAGLTRVNGVCQRPPSAAAAPAAPAPRARPAAPAPRVRARAAAPRVAATPRPRARVAAPAAPEEVAAPRRRARAAAPVRRPAPRVAAAPRPRGRAAPPAVRSAPQEAAPVQRTRVAAPVRRSGVEADLVVEPAPPVTALFPLVADEGPRFAAWATGFGDYERREGRGTANIQCCFALGGVPNALSLSVRSNTTTAGFVGGLDVTGRNIAEAGDGVITGVLTGYISSEVSVRTASLSQSVNVGNGSGLLRAHLSGPSVGFFSTYFNGGFSADLTYKADLLTLDERFTDVLAFAAQATPAGAPVTTTFSGAAGTSLTTHNIIANVNYRFQLGQGYWIEPTAGILYTATNYAASAARLGLDNGDLLRLQGGLRLGSTFETADRIIVTSSLTGLAYEDVLIRGGFIQGGAFGTSDILARSDEGRIRGAGVLDVNLDHGNGFSWFVQGGVRGGENLFGAGGKGGIRYQW